MSEVIIDIQGFKKGFNEFVLKELAIAPNKPDENGEIQPQESIVFDEPFFFEDLSTKYQKINNWLTQNYHGLPWDALGDCKYEDIADVLKEKLTGVTRIYVKGLEKKKWLKELIGDYRPIQNLEDWGCPKLEDLTEGDTCYQHRRFVGKGTSKHYHCALRNVTHLKAWFAKYLSGSMEKSLKRFCEHNKDLTMLTTEEIGFLPKFFILEFASTSIDEAWDMLPVSLQKDPEIMGYRRCREHWTSSSGDAIDGPPPFIKKCPLCQLFHQ